MQPAYTYSLGDRTAISLTNVGKSVPTSHTINSNRLIWLHNNEVRTEYWRLKLAQTMQLTFVWDSVVGSRKNVVPWVGASVSSSLQCLDTVTGLDVIPREWGGWRGL